VCSRCSTNTIAIGTESHRLCDKCYKVVMDKRHFFSTHSHQLVHDFAKPQQGSERLKLKVYSKGSWLSSSSAVWLSQTFLLICYIDNLGNIQGVPLHTLDCISEGLSDEEIKSRTESQWSMFSCCLPDNKDNFEEISTRIFRLSFTGALVLEFEANSVSIKADCVEKFKGLKTYVVDFAQWHWSHSEVVEQKLFEMEINRIETRDHLQQQLSSKNQDRVARKSARASTMDVYKRKYSYNSIS